MDKNRRNIRRNRPVGTLIGNDLVTNLRDIMEGKISIQEIRKIYVSNAQIQEFHNSDLLKEYEEIEVKRNFEKLMSEGKICFIEEEQLPELPRIERDSMEWNWDDESWVEEAYPGYKKYGKFLSHWCLDEIDFCSFYLREPNLLDQYDEMPGAEEGKEQVKKGNTQEILKLYFPQYSSVIDRMTPEMILDFLESAQIYYMGPIERRQEIERKYPDLQESLRIGCFSDSIPHAFRTIVEKEKERKGAESSKQLLEFMQQTGLTHEEILEALAALGRKGDREAAETVIRGSVEGCRTKEEEEKE